MIRHLSCVFPSVPRTGSPDDDLFPHMESVNTSLHDEENKQTASIVGAGVVDAPVMTGTGISQRSGTVSEISGDVNIEDGKHIRDRNGVCLTDSKVETDAIRSQLEDDEEKDNGASLLSLSEEDALPICRLCQRPVAPPCWCCLECEGAQYSCISFTGHVFTILLRGYIHLPTMQRSGRRQKAMASRACSASGHAHAVPSRSQRLSRLGAYTGADNPAFRDSRHSPCEPAIRL